MLRDKTRVAVAVGTIPDGQGRLFALFAVSGRSARR